MQSRTKHGELAHEYNEPKEENKQGPRKKQRERSPYASLQPGPTGRSCPGRARVEIVCSVIRARSGVDGPVGRACFQPTLLDLVVLGVPLL